MDRRKEKENQINNTIYIINNHIGKFSSNSEIIIEKCIFYEILNKSKSIMKTIYQFNYLYDINCQKLDDENKKQNFDT